MERWKKGEGEWSIFRILILLLFHPLPPCLFFYLLASSEKGKVYCVHTLAQWVYVCGRRRENRHTLFLPPPHSKFYCCSITRNVTTNTHSRAKKKWGGRNPRCTRLTLLSPKKPRERVSMQRNSNKIGIPFPSRSLLSIHFPHVFLKTNKLRGSSSPLTSFRETIFRHALGEERRLRRRGIL